MVEYNERSPEDEVNRYLNEKYEYSLMQFENSLHGIHTYYELISRKRSISEIRNNIEYLESSKEELVNKIKEILTKSKSWRWIKNNFPDIAEWTDEQKADFIRTKFQLHHYFEFTDLRINQLSRIINLITHIHFHAEDKRKRVQPETVIVLVWILAFKNSGLTINQSFTETRALLKWFFKNRKELLRELSDLQIYKSKDAIRHDYERYIQTPGEANKEYKEMAELLYSQCFCNID